MRYFIYLSYDGSGYCGWQIQPGSPSVQQTIENAFSLFMRQNIRVNGAGRTDTGVHARTMVAHFDLDNPADTLWMTSKLNCILPDDIAIQRIVPVAPSAHARFDATSRTYRYYVSLVKTPFAAKYSWQLSVKPDFELMNQAAKLLLDTSDFTSFSKLHTDTKTNNCRVIEADWEERGQGLWVFTITADRFLRNMVRAIVGTLLDVGRHKLTIADFTEIVNGLDRCLAGDSAPAHGLFLEGITYPEIIFNTTI